MDVDIKVNEEGRVIHDKKIHKKKTENNYKLRKNTCCKENEYQP